MRITCTNTYQRYKRLSPAMCYISVLNIENNFGYVYQRSKAYMTEYKPKWQYIKMRVNLFDADGVLINNQENIDRSLRRARVAVVDYAMTNHFDYFGTITFNSDWHNVFDYTDCMLKVRRAFNNYQQNFCKDFQYILVGEFGEEKGRLHFHFLIKNINKEELFINKNGWLDWSYTSERFGFTQITKIGDTVEDHEHVAMYCSKYITKQNIRISSHRYFASKTLKKPDASRNYSATFTAFVADWIQRNCEGIYNSYVDNRMCTCFSVPMRVYNDLMKAVEEWQTPIKEENRRVLLFHVPDSVPCPFDEVQLSWL